MNIRAGKVGQDLVESSICLHNIRVCKQALVKLVKSAHDLGCLFLAVALIHKLCLDSIAVASVVKAVCKNAVISRNNLFAEGLILCLQHGKHGRINRLKPCDGLIHHVSLIARVQHHGLHRIKICAVVHIKTVCICVCDIVVSRLGLCRLVGFVLVYVLVVELNVLSVKLDLFKIQLIHSPHVCRVCVRAKNVADAGVGKSHLIKLFRIGTVIRRPCLHLKFKLSHGVLKIGLGVRAVGLHPIVIGQHAGLHSRVNLVLDLRFKRVNSLSAHGHLLIRAGSADCSRRCHSGRSGCFCPHCQIARGRPRRRSRGCFCLGRHLRSLGRYRSLRCCLSGRFGRSCACSRCCGRRARRIVDHILKRIIHRIHHVILYAIRKRRDRTYRPFHDRSERRYLSQGCRRNIILRTGRRILHDLISCIHGVFRHLCAIVYSILNDLRAGIHRSLYVGLDVVVHACRKIHEPAFDLI